MHNSYAHWTINVRGWRKGGGIGGRENSIPIYENSNNSLFVVSMVVGHKRARLPADFQLPSLHAQIMGNIAPRQSYMLWEGLTVTVVWSLNLVVFIIALFWYLCKRRKCASAGEWLLCAARWFTEARNLLPQALEGEQQAPSLTELKENLLNDADLLKNIGDDLIGDEKYERINWDDLKTNIYLKEPQKRLNRQQKFVLTLVKKEGSIKIVLDLANKDGSTGLDISVEKYSKIAMLLIKAKYALRTASKQLTRSTLNTKITNLFERVDHDKAC